MNDFQVILFFDRFASSMARKTINYSLCVTKSLRLLSEIDWTHAQRTTPLWLHKLVLVRHIFRFVFVDNKTIKCDNEHRVHEFISGGFSSIVCLSREILK